MADDLLIRRMERDDAPVMSAAFTALGWHKPEGLYRRYYEEQAAGGRVALVALIDGEFAGYGNVVWESKYPPFRENCIPEISDLNVLPKFRRRRVATAIMDRAEGLIAERSDVAGIGVGLYTDYGPAQRMYVLRGYVPDACGATWKHRAVAGGQEVRADDDLILWFTKRLA